MFLQDFYWPLIGFLILTGSGSACEYSPGICGAWADGDIRIGVLSSCHSKVQTLHVRERPEKYNCSEWVYIYIYIFYLFFFFWHICKVICACVTMQPRRLWVLIFHHLNAHFIFVRTFDLLEWNNKKSVSQQLPASVFVNNVNNTVLYTKCHLIYVNNNTTMI